MNSINILYDSVINMYVIFRWWLRSLMKKTGERATRSSSIPLRLLVIFTHLSMFITAIINSIHSLDRRIEMYCGRGTRPVEEEEC